MQLPSPIPHPLEFLDPPGWIREALEWVVGVDWPEGNEKLVWDTADLWFEAAQHLVEPYRSASSAAAEVVAGWGGLDTAVAAAFNEAWDEVGGNDEAALAALSSLAHGLGELIESCGCDIQAAKIETYVELGLLLIELAALGVAAACTFGAASAAAGPAMFATRMAIQQIFKRLMMKLLRKTLHGGAEEAAERAAKVASKRGVALAARTGRHALEEGLEEFAVDYGTQSYQIGEGRRDGYDSRSLLTSFAAGAAGGAAGGLAGLGPSAESALGRFGEHIVRGAAGEVLAETGASIVTGQGLPDASNLARSATSGMASGGIQHAHHGLDHKLDAQMATLTGDFGAPVVSSPPSAPVGTGHAAGSAGDPAATPPQPAAQHTAAMNTAAMNTAVVPEPTGSAPWTQPSSGATGPNTSLSALAALSPDGPHTPHVQAALDQQPATATVVPAGGHVEPQVTLTSHPAPGSGSGDALPSSGQQPAASGSVTPASNTTAAFGAPVNVAAGPSALPTTATQTPGAWSASSPTTPTLPPPLEQRPFPPALDPALSRQIGDEAAATWNRGRTRGNWHEYAAERRRTQPDDERPDIVTVSDEAHAYLNREVLPTVQGGVTTGNRSALAGTDGPPVEATRSYGQRGGHREPLAYDQWALEQAMPRDAHGNVVRWADVEQPWFQLANDGGFEADPTRGLNCVDAVLSFFDTWAHGRPRVAAPRTFDAYAHADPDQPVGGERGGLLRAQRTLRSQFTTVYTETTATYDTPQAIYTERMAEISRTLEVAGPGSFAMIVNTWGLGGAHAWAAVNQDGRIKFVDPQNGFVYHGPLFGTEGTHGGVNRVDVIVLDPDGRPLHVTPDDMRQPLRSWEASEPTGADPEVATALAVECRTPNGLVDEAALARFIESVPKLDVDGPGGTVGALSRFTADALGIAGARVLPVDGGPGKGQSGAPVYLVTDESGQLVAVSKIFPAVEQMVRELSALDRLGADEFRHFAVPRARGAAVLETPGGVAGALVMSVAPGRSLFDLLTDVPKPGSPDRPKALAELKQAVADTAVAFAELHSRPAGSGGPVDAGFLRFNHGLAQQQNAALAAHRAILEEMELDVDGLSRRVDAAVQAVMAEPGGSTVMHGDAHPGNVFWDPTHGVTFIDTPNCHFSFDDAGRPIGSPARDISNMVERLAHFSREAGFEWTEITDLQTTFLEVYRQSDGPRIPDAADTAFTVKFAVRDILETLTALTEPNVEPQVVQRLQLQLEDEIALLRRALRWEP
ncbi:phosphotransferase [Planosporangium flavigriseum]|uniref:Phosphotransferase enzyme family protein n=1 Tax=Planosporangium flavigriseum TaxID=373681 RepID=A0A8J3LS61_9ACTN|nr:toxin glutamine deamidase domain-containing protein [Planosporangium flavigriseum]NJC68011.1 phosphotransferase [Planosporangium flavigriseum]GIG76634.1 hypothetical protein Pfl04_50380 [Planosporangium flavigriseum]